MFIPESLHAQIDILLKFFIRILRIPRFQPYLTRNCPALSAIGQTLVIFDALIYWARFSLRYMKYFSGAVVASGAHFSKTAASAAVRPADTDISILHMFIPHIFISVVVTVTVFITRS